MSAGVATAAPRTPDGTGRPKIQVRNVSRFFKGGAVHALDHVSVDVAPGEFVSLVGPSGCGKTTLLRVIDGLIAPDEGEVLVDGHKPKPGPDLGFMFQQARLMPWTSVCHNVEFPLLLKGIGAQERRERALRLLSAVGLRDFADNYPHELSGGMQQRVGLARAFVLEPAVLLMDEPFAALDAMTREFMRAELSRLWSRRKAAVVFVTHDIDEAIMLSQRIVLLAPRPGRIDEVIDVALPENRYDQDVRSLPEFRDLHEHLWGRIRTMVADSAEWAALLAGEEAETEAPGPAQAGSRWHLGSRR